MVGDRVDLAEQLAEHLSARHDFALLTGESIAYSLERCGLTLVETKALPVQDEAVERIALIMAPELWGSPFGFPDHIDSDSDLRLARADARSKARRILASLRPHTVGEDKQARENERLISEAARLIRDPGDGVSIFTIRVGEEQSQMHVRAGKDVDPRAAIDAAMGVLIAERGDLEGCPYHAALPRPPADEMRKALETCRDRFREYEDSHRRKVAAMQDGPAFRLGAETTCALVRETAAKAERNRKMAEMCDRALSTLTKEQGDA